MKTRYVKDIRVLSAFQQTIRAMQILILVLRVLAVAFLVQEKVFIPSLLSLILTIMTLYEKMVYM